MSLNMRTLTQALAKTAAVIEKTVQTTVQEVTGPRALQDYELVEQIGSAGPGLAWKLYSAKARGSTLLQQYPTVCVWVIDKRVLSEGRMRAGLSKAAEDAFLDVIRADAARLVRLRHPGVVHVVQAMDESKNAMAMVTEPMFASVANALGNVHNIDKVPKELKGMEMGLLEVKHGLLQIAETLEFLHNHARLVHQAISPENIVITSSGAWKLSGFGFTISTDQTSDNSANVQAFHYAEYDVEDSVLPLQPCLNYTAPELVRSKASVAAYYSDIFSLGCVAYHLIAHTPLFDCHNNVKMYMNTLNYLSGEAFSMIPLEFVSDMKKMLSTTESLRPTALEFTGSPFFRDDTRLRALRFLDHMLERDNMQKSEFLKALSDMWKDFDSRVLRYKVLPPLCAELRNMVMQPMILPMVLTIAESQDKIDFELSTLPALVPVLSTAAGETLLLLIKHANLIINKTSQEHLVAHVLPLFVRAYSDSDARMQEEVMKKSVLLAKQLDIELVKQVMLPRIHGLALKTTVAAVRVNALLCLGDLVHMLGKRAVLEILQTIGRCTAVDRSAPTLMCTLGVADSILRQYGVEFVAEHVLPLVVPLLTAQQLNAQQFAKYMFFVKDVLRKIEEGRGISLNNSGARDGKSPSLADGLQSEALTKTSGTVSSAKNAPSWDEDWGPTKKGPTTSLHPSSSNASSISPNLINPSTQLHSSNKFNSPVSPLSHRKSSQSCAPVDLEWPRAPSTLDDIDPFVDWPPRPGGGGSSFNSGVSSNGIGSQHNTNNLSFKDQGYVESMGQEQGFSTWDASGGKNGGSNPHNSLGFLKQNQGFKKEAVLGSALGLGKNEQAAPRLAPPPSTVVGRGKGKGRGNQGRTGRAPLLDLL